MFVLHKYAIGFYCSAGIHAGHLHPVMEKILLADKQSLIQTGLKQILKLQYPHAEILAVGDGESLMKEVLHRDWDIVITDLYLPGFNGIRSLKKLKSEKPDLPFLILSIYNPELYAVRVLKAGASGYLNKDTSPEELITAVQRCLAGKKYISEAVADKLLRSIDTEREPHELLTNKELEVFKLLALGKSVTQISQYLSMAIATSSTYRTRILHKLDMSSNSEITRYAISHNIVSDLDFYSIN